MASDVMRVRLHLRETSVWVPKTVSWLVRRHFGTR